METLAIVAVLDSLLPEEPESVLGAYRQPWQIDHGFNVQVRPAGPADLPPQRASIEAHSVGIAAGCVVGCGGAVGCGAGRCLTVRAGAEITEIAARIEVHRITVHRVARYWLSRSAIWRIGGIGRRMLSGFGRPDSVSSPEH